MSRELCDLLIDFAHNQIVQLSNHSNQSNLHIDLFFEVFTYVVVAMLSMDAPLALIWP
jgi:hypothetical protein